MTWQDLKRVLYITAIGPDDINGIVGYRKDRNLPPLDLSVVDQKFLERLAPEVFRHIDQTCFHEALDPVLERMIELVKRERKVHEAREKNNVGHHLDG